MKTKKKKRRENVFPLKSGQTIKSLINIIIILLLITSSF